MAQRRNSIRSAAALVAAVANQQAAQDAALEEARDRAVLAAKQAQMERDQSPLQAPSVARQRQQGSMAAPKVSSKDGIHLHINMGSEKPALQPDGQSGPQATNGSTAVRRATAAEKLAYDRVMSPLGQGGVGQRAETAKAVETMKRVGHKFKIELRPDGTIVHRYGNDVPADQRNQVIRAAHRLAANGGLRA